MIEPPIRLEQYSLLNIHGNSIRLDVRYTENEEKKPIIIICHSFMAFKNWGFFPYLAERIAEAGYISVIFNFSLNGVIGDGSRITDFDAFAKNTFSRELEDLNTVVNACRDGVVAKTYADNERIGILGHSRGGGIAIVHTAHDKRIKALTTLSTISTFDRWREHQKIEWRKQGYLALARDSTVSPLRLDIDLLKDIETNSERLNILNSASEITCPWLIVHGKTDVTVHVKEAEALFNASNKSSTQLSLFEHIGHLYNAASPNEDQYKTLNTIVEPSIQFFKRSL